MIVNDPAIRPVCSFWTLRCFPSGAMELHVSRWLKRSVTQSVLHVRFSLPLDSAPRLWPGASSNKGKKVCEYLSLFHIQCHHPAAPLSSASVLFSAFFFASILTDAFLVAALVSYELESLSSLSISPDAQEMFLYSFKVALLQSSVYLAEVAWEPLHDVACLALSNRS